MEISYAKWLSEMCNDGRDWVTHSPLNFNGGWVAPTEVIRNSVSHLPIKHINKSPSMIFHTPTQRNWRGMGGILVSLRPPVCPSVCPSDVPCLSGSLPIPWIIFIRGTNKIHGGMMCRVPFPGQ